MSQKYDADEFRSRKKSFTEIYREQMDAEWEQQDVKKDELRQKIRNAYLDGTDYITAPPYITEQSIAEVITEARNDGLKNINYHHGMTGYNVYLDDTDSCVLI